MYKIFFRFDIYFLRYVEFGILESVKFYESQPIEGESCKPEIECEGELDFEEILPYYLW